MYFYNIKSKKSSIESYYKNKTFHGYPKIFLTTNYKEDRKKKRIDFIVDAYS